MMHYVKTGAFAVAAVYIALMLPVVGDALRKEMQKAPSA